MEEISKGIFSRYKRRELEAVLQNYDNATQIVVPDLDGTLHRGLCPSKLRGATNADLAIITTFYLLSAPALIPNHIKRNVRLMRYEKSKQPSDWTETSGFEERLILDFFSCVMNGVPQKALRRASSQLPKLAYKKAKESILEIGRNSSSTVLISKAADIVLESYCNWFKEKGHDVSYRGNKLIFDRDHLVGIDADNRITRRCDKKEACASEIQGYERAIILGDTLEDIGMFEAADDLGIRALKVAVHPKQEELSRKVDVVLYSWKNFYGLIKKKLK